jgi:acetoin utilization deacetylase AcuC-like enzyme
MSTALITHPDCLKHEVPPGHPERPERLSEILKLLYTPEFDGLLRREASLAGMDAIIRVHSEDHVRDLLDSIPQSGFVRLDSDTMASPGSGDAALRAAGAVVLAIDMVMAGEVANAFCAVRPPGHHATRSESMGFCLFNNVAIGALHARAIHGLKRIAVVDFDVHHGNGTQDTFSFDRELFYASTHQWPLYPGTGRPSETGIDHNVLNLPLTPGASGKEFRRAFETSVIPALSDFRPDFLIISAGFDAHRADPLAQLQLEETDFAWATEALCALARKACDGRVVSALEGGYDLDATARSARAHLRAMMAAGSGTMHG